MTLFQKLLSWILVIFFIIAGTFITIQVNTTYNYLKEQQTIEVNNTLNTIGLAMTPYLETKDEVAIESVIQALFDGGYYSKIKLTFLANDNVIERNHTVKEIDVPHWFTSLPLFQPISQTQVLTSGWLQLAEINIVAEPSYAYMQLWSIVKNICVGFVLLFVIAGLFLSFMLSRMLQPIKNMSIRAREISKNDFGKALPLPSTKDLKKLVLAFNHMQENLKLHFKQQAQEAEQLRDRAYKDESTGLINRKYFINQMDAWLIESGVGGLGLLSSQIIKDLYDNDDYETRERTIKELASVLHHSIEGTDIILARFSNHEFAFLMPGATETELMDFGQQIVSLANDFQTDSMGLSPETADIGLVYCEKSNSRGDIFIQLDNALNQAKQLQDSNAFLIKYNNEQQWFGKKQWGEQIKDAIANDELIFKYQTVIDPKNKIIHQEVFTAIERENEYFSASKFLWTIEKELEGITFDKAVIKNMITKLESDIEHPPVAINLTWSSITNTSFILWLDQELKIHKALAQRMLFEIQESVLLRNKEQTLLFYNTIKQHKFKYGIDNYGRNFKSLDYLEKFKPDYVKLDYMYTSAIGGDHQNNDLLVSICRTAHDLGIVTIATRVETDQQLNTLSMLHVDGFQGFIFNKNEA